MFLDRGAIKYKILVHDSRETNFADRFCVLHYHCISSAWILSILYSLFQAEY